MTLEYGTILWIAYYAVSLAAIAVAIMRRRGVPGTLAWISAIIAFPGIGAIAYFLLADPSLKTTTRRKRLTIAEVRRLFFERLPASPGATEVATRLAPTAKGLLSLATALTGIKPTGGNACDLLTENEAAFHMIEEALCAAKQAIWAEYYIIQCDDTGRRFFEILAERARAGVDVRLLYDAVGSASLDGSCLEALLAAGGKAEAFLPLNPLRRRWAVHLRNHRKIIVVDGEVGFTGGMNIGDEYSGSRRRRRLGPWRDTHLRIRGPAVRDLALTFAEDWDFATGERILPADRAQPIPGASSIIAVIPSGPDQENLNATGYAYFAAITSAQSRCYLTSPYFVPDEPTLRALQSAALRGVDVRILVPSRSDIFAMLPAVRSYYPSLLRAGVRVYEYGPAILHAKTIVVDGTISMVGSANVDVRSFRLNFELGAAIVDAEFGRELEERFRKDLEQSREITVSAVARRGRVEKLKEGLARLLSPLL